MSTPTLRHNQYFVCHACGRRIFSNGGHLNGCRLDRPMLRDHPGFIDREPLDEQRFVNPWDEATYYSDGMEGDRQ